MSNNNKQSEREQPDISESANSLFAYLDQLVYQEFGHHLNTVKEDIVERIDEAFATHLEAVKREAQLSLMDELEQESYLEQEPKGQNALRAKVIRVSSLNNKRRQIANLSPIKQEEQNHG